MEIRSLMINIYSYNESDFKAVFSFEGWKIGLLRYSDRFSHIGIWERHTQTAEVFVLMSGTAELYIKSNQNIISEKMEANKVYEVPKGEWHHIVVSKDATVLVIENSDTSKDNTEKQYD